jgi:cation transport ATPase
MAQTRKKRRSKHRGTAAGTIQARGRTGRPLTTEERKKQVKAEARERRMSAEPTWRSSLQRAAFAAVIMFVFLLLTTHGKNRVAASIIFAVLALALYVPAGYYLERLLWRRRQRNRAAAAGGGTRGGRS